MLARLSICARHFLAVPTVNGDSSKIKDNVSEPLATTTKGGKNNVKITSERLGSSSTKKLSEHNATIFLCSFFKEKRAFVLISLRFPNSSWTNVTDNSAMIKKKRKRKENCE